MLPFGSEEIPPELRAVAGRGELGAISAICGRRGTTPFARGDAGIAFEAQRIVITVPASFDEARAGSSRARRRGWPATPLPSGCWRSRRPRSTRGSTAIPPPRVPRAHRYSRRCRTSRSRRRRSSSATSAAAPPTSACSGSHPCARPAGRRRSSGSRPSDHLLLGGDNIDLALAHALERKLKPDTDERLSRRQWSHLVPQARHLKETVLAPRGRRRCRLDRCHVAVPGEGAASVRRLARRRRSPRAEVRAIVLRRLLPADGGRRAAPRATDRAARDRPAVRVRHRQ